MITGLRSVDEEALGRKLEQTFKATADKRTEKARVAQIEGNLNSQPTTSKLVVKAPVIVEVSSNNQRTDNFLVKALKKIKGNISFLLPGGGVENPSDEYADTLYELNQKLCKLHEDTRNKVSVGELAGETSPKALYLQGSPVLESYMEMAKDLGDFSLTSNQAIVKNIDYESNMVLSVSEGQIPCHTNKDAFLSYFRTLSKLSGNRGDNTRWLVYKALKINKTFIDHLDSMEAYTVGLNMLEVLAKDGHLAREDYFKIKRLKEHLSEMNGRFVAEVQDQELESENLENIVAIYSGERAVLKVKMKTYLKELSIKYPAYEPTSLIKMPELI